MRWPSLGRRGPEDPGTDLGAPELEIVQRLAEALDAAPPPRHVDDARLLVLRELDEGAVAPAGIGLVAAGAVALVMAVLIGLGGAYVGSLVADASPVPETPASGPAAPSSTHDPLPTVEPRGSSGADASAEPTLGGSATPSPTPAATPGVQADPPAAPSPTPPPVPADDGPPPWASPGGPPSPMPGPPIGGGS